MRGCIVTLVAFIWPFSTVSFQMCPQSTCIRGCKHTLVAICLTFLHCGYLHAPSKCLPAWMHSRIGYICLTFLRCGFYVPPNSTQTQYMTDVERFQISPHAVEFRLFPHNRGRKMWIFAKYGGISHISTWQAWRNEKITLFCCFKICFVTNYTVFAKSVLARFTHFCVEKNWAKNWARGEKITNMRCCTRMLVLLLKLKYLQVGD